MLIQRSLSSFLAVAISAALSAQLSVTVPAGTSAVEGNTNNTFPWGSTSTTFPGLRTQLIYDSSNFTSQGVVSPIVITRLRWRANGSTSTWVGGVYANATVSLGTCPVDQALVTANFVNQQGPDFTACYTGPVQFLAGTGAGTTVPGPTVVDVALSTPFVYDPSLGDLVIDCDHLLGANFTPNAPTGTNRVAVDVQSTGALASRCFGSTSYPNANGTSTSHGVVVTLDYTPAAGLYASFVPSATAGPSPLTVQFTDNSFTSAPSGVTSWAWDFENDGVIDSTQRNPSHTYSSCGQFTVALTVTDGVNPPNTITRTNLIRTDDIVASFTTSVIASPNIYQLTDTSTPPATSWAWDTDGDGVDDQFTQNAVAALVNCQSTTVRLTATRNCRSSVKTQTIFTATNTLQTAYNAANGLSSGAIVFSDLQVANPRGITLCGIGNNTGTTVLGTPFTINLYVTEGSYVGKDADIAKWRLVGTGAGTAQGNNVESTAPLAAPVHLPVGSYGIGVHMVGASVRYTGTTGTVPLVVSNADMTITTGAARSTLFGGSAFSVRQWNGTLHYDTYATNASAQYGYVGAGCAGTLPVSAQAVASRPQLGSNLSIGVNNLPFSLTLMMIGFSNQVATGFGPLPIDLTPIGMPGCVARVSPDLTTFVLGAATQAQFVVGIPNDPAFAGVPMFTQALTPDTSNAFGYILSDAAGGLIGF